MRKRILVLGAAGMAGHMIHKYLISLDKYNVWATTRTPSHSIESFVVDVEKDLDDLLEIILKTKFDVIINCIGVLVKPAEESPTRAILINSYFPQFLAEYTKGTNTRVIH